MFSYDIFKKLKPYYNKVTDDFLIGNKTLNITQYDERVFIHVHNEAGFFIHMADIYSIIDGRFSVIFNDEAGRTLCWLTK